MIKHLKKLVDKLGAAKVASDLGYKSPSTIYHWFKNETVPNLAAARVKQYIKENKNVKKRS